MGDLVDLANLKSRLARLGVEVSLDLPIRTKPAINPLEPAAKQPKPSKTQPPASNSVARNKKQVVDLLDKINKVEVALNTAEALNTAAQHDVDMELATIPEPCMSTSPGRDAAKLARRVKSARAQIPTSPASKPTGASKAPVHRSVDLLKGVPAHTPLSSVLSQYKESELAWAHDKTQLRKELLEQRKRANKYELELKRLQRLSEHKTLDVKALKSALKNRDAQLEAATGRIKELEDHLARSHEEAVVKVSALVNERDDLKALLLATLQRLEAVDEVVHRADVSSALMQDKLKALEEERLKALEAAARARAEVQDLTESRRKLQWQSKLLEKMTEVQLKHNQHKSEAIKRLLAGDPQAANKGDAASILAESDIADDSTVAGTDHGRRPSYF